ncbi:hypothetical protein [[Mycoplasma] anseris]|nr:hypothetical protein [[Mycoplasma] anseris]
MGSNFVDYTVECVIDFVNFIKQTPFAFIDEEKYFYVVDTKTEMLELKTLYLKYMAISFGFSMNSFINEYLAIMSCEDIYKSYYVYSFQGKNKLKNKLNDLNNILFVNDTYITKQQFSEQKAKYYEYIKWYRKIFTNGPIILNNTLAKYIDNAQYDNLNNTILFNDEINDILDEIIFEHFYFKLLNNKIFLSEEKLFSSVSNEFQKNKFNALKMIKNHMDIYTNGIYYFFRKPSIETICNGKNNDEFTYDKWIADKKNQFKSNDYLLQYEHLINKIIPSIFNKGVLFTKYRNIVHGKTNIILNDDYYWISFIEYMSYFFSEDLVDILVNKYKLPPKLSLLIFGVNNKIIHKLYKARYKENKNNILNFNLEEFLLFDYDIPIFIKHFLATNILNVYEELFKKKLNGIDYKYENQNLLTFNDLQINLSAYFLNKDYVKIVNSKLFKDFEQLIIHIKRNSMSMLSIIEEYFKNYVLNETELNIIFQNLLNWVENNLSNKWIFSFKKWHIRAFEALLARYSNFLICGNNRKWRWREFDKYNYDDFLEKIEIFNYKNMIFTTRIIYNKNIDTMKEYDIRNEHELHCILRKLFNYKILVGSWLFKKMPTLVNGNVNEDQQLLNFIKSVAPIHKEELYQKYADEYGFEKFYIPNKMNNFLELKSLLDNNDVYNYNTILLNEEQVQEIKTKIVEPIEVTSDIEKIIANILEIDIFLVNKAHFKQIGYIRNSELSYQDKYLNLSDALYKGVIEGQKVVSLYDSFKFIKDGISGWTYNMFYVLLKEFKLLKISSDKCITLESLLNSDTNINLNDLYNFIEDALLYEKNEMFFTFESLLKRGFKHKILDLGFNNYFYNSILNYGLDSKFIVMRKPSIYIRFPSKEITSFNEFIYHIMFNDIWKESNNSQNMNQPIFIENIVEFLNDKYCIEINSSKLIKALEQIGCYVTKNALMVYDSKENYINWINIKKNIIGD